jgi:hypothetical protein
MDHSVECNLSWDAEETRHAGVARGQGGAMAGGGARKISVAVGTLGLVSGPGVAALGP